MSGRLDVEVFGVTNILLMGLLMAIFAMASGLVSRLLGLSSYDSTAINMEVVVRNVNLGIMLKASLFPAIVGKVDPIGDMVLFSLLAYGAIQLVIAAGIICWRRRGGQAATA